MAEKIPSDTFAIILAAGEGARFFCSQQQAGVETESNKLLANFRTRPLIVAAVASACDAGFETVVVVEGAVSLRSALEDLGPQVVVIINKHWQNGLASSLTVGIKYCEQLGAQSVVVGLGDQPFVSASMWFRLATARAPICVFESEVGPCPPVKLAHQVWAELPDSGDIGARQLMAARPELVETLPSSGLEPADQNFFVDMDTVANLERWG